MGRSLATLSLLLRFQMVLPVRSEMLEATASELESSKAEACIKSSDLQALSSALSHAEEQHAAAAAAAAASHAASSETIVMLEVHINSSPAFLFSERLDALFRRSCPMCRRSSKRRMRALWRRRLRSRCFRLRPTRRRKSLLPSHSKLRSCR